jgi:hypothetical protein
MELTSHEQRCILARQVVWFDRDGHERCFVKMVTTWVSSAPWWESQGYSLLFREPEPTIDISGFGEPQSGPRIGEE